MISIQLYVWSTGIVLSPANLRSWIKPVCQKQEQNSITGLMWVLSRTTMNSGERHIVDCRKLYARLPAFLGTVRTWSWNFIRESTKTPRSVEDPTTGMERPFRKYDGGEKWADGLEKRRTAHFSMFMYRPQEAAVVYSSELINVTLNYIIWDWGRIWLVRMADTCIYFKIVSKYFVIAG